MSDKFTFRDGTLTDAAEMARLYNHYVATSEVIFSATILSDAFYYRLLETKPQ